MKIEIENGRFFRRCNFCGELGSRNNVLYNFIRNQGNSLKAIMCENCLNELIKFRDNNKK